MTFVDCVHIGGKGFRYDLGMILSDPCINSNQNDGFSNAGISKKNEVPPFSGPFSLSFRGACAVPFPILDAPRYF